MNLNDTFNLLEADKELKICIGSISKVNRRTKAHYLESLSWFSYLLYLERDESLSEKLLETIVQIPFEGDYNYWTFVENAIVLLAFIQKSDKDKVTQLRNLILDSLNYGADSTIRIKNNVHKRFLGGATLENKISKINAATKPELEIENRLIYLSELLKLNLFIADSSFSEEDIHSKIDEQITIIHSFIDINGTSSLFPFKGRR